MKKLLGKIKLHKSKKANILLITGIALSLIAAVLLQMSENEVKALSDQQAAARWEYGKKSYAQASAFFSPVRNVQAADITDIQTEILRKLSEDGYLSRDEGPQTLLMAYSGEAGISIRKDSNSVPVTATGVSGDFFMFHPIPLLSGSYFTEEDLNQDRIILDEATAWALFGSNDIAGMDIWIDNFLYDVAGVVKVPEDEMERNAYGSSGRIYIPYECLKKHQENLAVSCFETVLPNPISNYGYNTLKTACGMEEGEEEGTESNPLSFGDCTVVENSSRYTAFHLFSMVKNRKYQVMQTAAVAYPYWENVARVYENIQMNRLIFETGLLVLSFLSVVSALILYIHGMTFKSSFFHKMEEKNNLI